MVGVEVGCVDEKHIINDDRKKTHYILRWEGVGNSVVLLSPECAAHSGDNSIRRFWKNAKIGRKSPQCTPIS